MSDPEIDQECVVEGCRVRGFPSDGFCFYICDGCLDELEDMIVEAWKRMVERHALN